MNDLTSEMLVAAQITSAAQDDYIRFALLGLLVFGCSIAVWLLVESFQARQRQHAYHAEIRDLLDEMRSQHLKDSYVNQALGLHQVIDLAHRGGSPLEDELRGQVHDAINEAFDRYRAVAAALASDPNWKRTGPQRITEPFVSR